MRLAHCVAAQVAPLCRVRAASAGVKKQFSSPNSNKGRANGSRPRAGLWIVVTWTLVDDRADGSMQHPEQQQQLALATSTSGLTDTNVLVSLTRRTSQLADLHLHLPRTLRHDSAAVQPLAGRAYQATRLDSSDQAAVLVSGTVGWRPETSWFGLQLRHYSPRHLRSGRSEGPTPVRNKL